MNKDRMVYVDNIRSLIIIFVVIAHVFITYSGVGGWYYIENNYDEINTFELIFFGFFISLTAAYSMGLLFLFAGYFVPITYNRKGLLRFLKNRFVRLGIPLLFYIFVINPFDFYFLLADYLRYSKSDFFLNYRSYILNYEFIEDSGPLWFAFVLLIFSIIYILARILFSVIKKAVNLIYKKDNDEHIRLLSINIPPTLTAMLTIFIVISLIILNTFITYYVRLIYPIGTEVYNYQLCFYTQYVILFITGIVIYQFNLLEKLSYKFGITWFKIGFPISIIMFGLLSYFGGAINGTPERLLGGPYIQSALYALWESITCATMILGLIAIFRRRFNKRTKLSKFLSKQAFGVYVLHTPILIYITLLFKNIEINLIVKSIIVSIITIPLTFFVSFIVNFLRNQIKKVFI